MKENWESFKETLTEERTMSKREFLLTIAVCILGGIVFGMLCSPKKSVVIGSNNGNNSGNGSGGCDCGCEEEIAQWNDEEIEA